MKYIFFILFSFLIRLFSLSYINSDKYNQKFDNSNFSYYRSDIYDFSYFPVFDLCKIYLDESLFFKCLIHEKLKIISTTNALKFEEGKNDNSEKIFDLLRKLREKDSEVPPTEIFTNAKLYKNKSSLNFEDSQNNEIKNAKYNLGNLSSIEQFKKMNEIFNNIMPTDPNSFYKIKKAYNAPSINDILALLPLIQKYTGSYAEKVGELLVKLYFDRRNANILIQKIGDFVKENKGALPGLKNFLLDEKVKSLLIEFFESKQQHLFRSLLIIILEKDEALDIFFKIVEDDKIREEGMKLLINRNNNTFIYENFPMLFQDILALDNTYLLKLVRNALYVVGDYKGREEFKNSSIEYIQNKVRDTFDKMNILSYEISSTCIFLINNTFLNSKNNGRWNQIILTYIRKLIFDSPINKGDFMSFDNCLSEETKEINQSKNFTYYIKPVFAVGIIDNKSKLNYTNSTYYEKYEYVSNFCFPFGFTNDSNVEKAMCSEDDYNKIIRFLGNFYADNNDNVTTILLYDNKIKLDSSDYTIGILCIFIIAIPLIIKIGLIISKFILDKKAKKVNKINQLINEQDEYNEIKAINDDELKQNKKSNSSKCHKILNSFFSFYKNGKELFNFNLNNNNTNLDNINGITYIKGLIGLSIILNVFGLTFTILMNIQVKNYGIWHFYGTLNNILFVILYIGYRYSPRILFSCSGYTLAYKYLCFIEQERGLYFLKFIFLQSYKYIFLYFNLIIFKYTILRIFYIFRDLKRPVWSLLEDILNNESFLSSAFTLFFDFKNLRSENRKQNLIFNFYMPINEIFFFLFGMVLLSLGFRFKLRIDFVIIGLILIIFIAKIILYCVSSGFGFSTIDYYIFDFGILILTPSYNISYFLIGMYFGLINYTIQKGINNIYKESRYTKYYLLEETKKNSAIKEDIRSEKISINYSRDNNENQNYNLRCQSQIIEKRLDKYLDKREYSFVSKSEGKSINDQKAENELNEHIKKIPFLKSPFQFLNLNKKYKDRLCYKILIFLAIFIMLLLCYTKYLFVVSLSYIDSNSTKKDFINTISLEKVISNFTLNIINVFDIDIIVFLSHWIIFILFFKEVNIIRDFCNSIYWSFFVKSYFSYLIISIPVVLCILYESESIIKLHIYNFIFFSLINIVIIFIFVVLFYSVFELPIKKLFKYFLRGNEIIDEEDENDEEEIEDEKEEDMNFLDE